MKVSWKDVLHYGSGVACLAMAGLTELGVQLPGVTVDPKIAGAAGIGILAAGLKGSPLSGTKAVILALLGASLFASQAYAEGTIPNKAAFHHAFMHVAANTTTGRSVTVSKHEPTKSASTTDPISFLKSFAADDVQNALNEATAQNNIVTKPCWTFILGVINGSTPSIVPNQLGLATAIETALDDQALLANYFTAGGTFDQFNVACGPMINKINATIIAGGATVASGLIGGPAASGAVLKGLTLMLTGAAAIPKL